MKNLYVPTIRLAEALRGLPGVARTANRWVKEQLAARGALVWDGSEVAPSKTPNDLVDVPFGTYGHHVVLKSAGVLWLLGEYRAGRLPLRKGASPGPIGDQVLKIEQHPEGWDIEVSDPAEQPVDFYSLEVAFWRWVDEGCPSKDPKERMRWADEHDFVMRGVTYTRSSTPLRSNSRKTQVGRHTVFNGSDGSSCSNDPVLNRGNDPVRNWGLGRE